MKKFFLGLALTTLFLTGCKDIELKDGAIPAEHLNKVQPYLGQYKGQFNGFEGILTLSMQGDRPHIAWKDRRGNDLLAPNCQSLVGLAKTLWVSSDESEVTDISFAFDPGQCIEVQGRTFSLSFKQKSGQVHISAQLLKRIEYSQQCYHTAPGVGPGGAHYPGQYVCNQVQNQINYFGSMTKM